MLGELFDNLVFLRRIEFCSGKSFSNLFFPIRHFVHPLPECVRVKRIEDRPRTHMPFRRSPFYSVPSGICSRLGSLQSCNPINCFHEFLPTITLSSQDFLSFSSQTVIAPSPLCRLFDPRSLNPLPFLQSIKQWIKRCDIELQGSFRSLLDQRTNLISVA